MTIRLPVARPVAASVAAAVRGLPIGWPLVAAFNPGLWDHAAATASGGSQILGPNRYRIYSSAGELSQVQVPGVLTSGRAYQFQLTFETPVLGTQIQVGDAGANTDDFVSSLAGTRTVAFVADGTVATLKRPYVGSAGVPTDVVVKNVAVTDITDTALSITSQPQGRSIVAGNTATFSVTVAAPFTALFYRWEASTNGGVSWAGYSGGPATNTPTGSTLTTAAMTTADNGARFRCRIRMGNTNNATGQIYSDAATLTVAAANANPVAPTLDLGDLTVGTGYVKSSGELLAGATDADGDALTVTSVTAVSGGTVTGTGPYTITPSAEGAGSATVVISDGRGGSVNRTVTWTGVAVPATPTISGVTGTIAHGQTITVSGAGLGQAPTLLRIAGDEGAVGTSVAAATGMTVHGTTGNEWLFEAGGTMVLDMQAAAPKTVYKWFGGTAYKEAFLYYERQHFDVGALNPEGKGQVKEVRFAGSDEIGGHSDDPELGTVWDVPTSILYRFCGYAGQLNLAGATRAVMTAWSSQLLAGRIVGANAVGDYEIYGDGFTSRLLGDTAPAPDTKGYGQIFLPFYRSPDFSTSMRMRNIIALAGRQRLEVRNSANPATANRVVVLHANDEDITPTEMLVKLDLARFSVNDGLYLFAVNANGEYSAAYELRPETVPDSYNPLTDNFGIRRPTHNGTNGILTIPDYSAAAAAADSLRFQFGFVVEGLDSFASGTPIHIGLSRNATNQYRGNIRIDKTTGQITIGAMVNNARLVLAGTSDVHSNLGVRRDWELVIPKNTGEMLTLTDMQTGTLIGSVARPAAFDGFSPTWWMFANGNTEGSLKGRIAYLRCWATTAGVEATLFDFRFTAEQAGLTSVPSAHDAGVLATLGAALTWGAA